VPLTINRTHQTLSHLLLALIRHPSRSIEMTLKLSTLSILIGLGMGLPQIYGLVKPKEFAVSVRKFPRNVPIGIGLMLLATAWFIWILSQEAVSDFANYQSTLCVLFAAVGVGTCVYVQDFIAVRGLAVVLLLVAKLMADSGRPMLEKTHWTLVIQTWAYVLVIAGIWLTLSPWRLRDLLNWATANEKRVRIGSAIRLAFGLFVAVLGLTKFH
jgi:predicted DNA-binding transcriptional regulator AlpA